MGSTVHLLVIDNRDSFVYNVVELLRSLPELTFEVIPEGELELSLLPEHDGLILSPGPGVPSEFPRMQALIRAEAGVKPILGICLGHQALAEHYGAKLVQLPAPRHGHASALVVIDLRIASSVLSPREVSSGATTAGRSTKRASRPALSRRLTAPMRMKAVC